MECEVVVVVATESAALKIIEALQGMDDQGVIELHVVHLLSRESNGNVKFRETREARVGLAAALIAPVGALVGLLQGPVVAAGTVATAMAVGATATLLGGIAYYGLASDFVHGIAAGFRPGQFAVSASVWEDDPKRIDDAVAPYKGVVFRQTTSTVLQDQMREHLRGDEQGHGGAPSERGGGGRGDGAGAGRSDGGNGVGQSNGSSSGKAMRRVEQSRRRALFDHWMKDLEKGWEAKLASLDEKCARSTAGPRARHDANMSSLSSFIEEQKKELRSLLK
jgi:uncharacterized membrane protein